MTSYESYQLEASRAPVQQLPVLAPRSPRPNGRATFRMGFVGIRLALALAAVSGPHILSVSAPIADAQSCPDVEVIFARGTGEPAGPGRTGQAFVDSLRSRLVAQSLRLYSVNYPASDEWATGVDGVRDAGAHVLQLAQSCPSTRIVLGGYSQGAAVMGFVTSAVVPDGVDPETVPKPMQPQVADHVAAVVLFGTPNLRAMNFLGQPPLVIGPLYQAKTVQVCVAEDPVCSEGLNFAAHSSYASDGTVIDQGVEFAANRLATRMPRPTVPSLLDQGAGN